MASIIQIDINPKLLVTINGNIGHLYDNDEACENFKVEIDLECILVKNQTPQNFLQKLKVPFTNHNIESHFDNILYLILFTLEHSGGRNYIIESHSKSAIDLINDLIRLKALWDTCETSEIGITINNRNETKSKPVKLAPIAVSAVRDTLYNQVFSSYLYAINSIRVDGPEIQKDNLTIALLEERKKLLRRRTGAHISKSNGEVADIISYYLNTVGIAMGNTGLSSSQAAIIFDIMAAIDLINDNAIQSREDDYIRSLIKNSKISK